MSRHSAVMYPQMLEINILLPLILLVFKLIFYFTISRRCIIHLMAKSMSQPVKMVV